MATAVSAEQISALTPSRLLLLGDAHGDARFVSIACDEARRHGCPVIVQLGDFGFWSHTREGQAYLEVCSELVGDDLRLLFVDGNHENHALLRQLYQAAGEPEALEVAPGVWHLARGTRWQWAGRTYAAFGGAGSVDRTWRSPGYSWWETEVLTEEDLARLGDGPVDVLFAHDAPSVAAFKGGFPLSDYDKRRLAASRAVLDAAIEQTRPTLVAHGHWHRRHTWMQPGPDGHWVESLADNTAGFEQAAVVLDTAQLAVTTFTPAT